MSRDWPDPWTEPPERLGRIIAAGQAGDDEIFLRSPGSKGGGQLFLGVYRAGELDAYAFIAGPAVISLSDGRWVLAGPISTPATSVSVRVGSARAQDLAVADEGWLCIVGPEQDGELAVVTLRREKSSERHELRLGGPATGGSGAR
jgi:hypothetical protein